jgi:hypothetical protein
MRWGRRLGFVCVLLLAACSPRQEAPLPPAAPPPPPPRAPAASGPLQPGAPGTSQLPLADPERDAVLFTHWRAGRPGVDAFEEFLVRENVAQVVPTYQLLRSASMWKECRAEPFEVPPPAEWPRVLDLLRLVRHLQAERVLPVVEVVSAYRDPRLNRCAGGAAGSSHQRFAIDIAPLPESDGARLCRFWREQGRSWDMGVSRYPSGRIHIDRTGWRTWGATHKRGSSYCVE